MQAPGAAEIAGPSPAESDGARSVITGLAALAGGHMAVDCFTAIWPVYKTIAGLDLARAGLIATVASVLANGLQVIFGLLADGGFARVLLLGGVLLAGAVSFLPYTTSYAMYFVLVTVTAIGSAAYHPTATGTAGGLTRTRTGLFVAWFLAGGYLGYGLSQLAFTAVHRVTHGRTAVLLAISVVAALALARYAPPRTSRPISVGAWARDLRSAAGRLWVLFGIQVFAAAVNMSVVFLLPDLLLARGASRWIVEGGGHLALVCGACLALVPAGHASDRLGARRMLVVTNLACGVLLVLVLRDGAGASTLLPLIAAFGACNSCNGVVAISEGNRMMPGRTSGISALLMGLPWCVAAFAPIIAGSLARHGTPATALRWMALVVPVTIGLCFLLPRASRRATA